MDTEYGPVVGQTIPLDDGKSVNSFKGIPFARPPLGELRFEPPQKPDLWLIFNGNSLGLPCVQNPAGILWMTHPGWLRVSEDCLNLNIYTPEDMSGGPYPVMVWFHGGGYYSGANIQYPGHFLASYGVVVVVPNYRLGIFGFLSTPDGTLKGNAGMLDQVLALEFVRDNIANFGGDPDLVTVFGQSAGASSSALHLLSPLSQDLVHQAICESGADTNMWTIHRPESEPERYVYQTAEKTNCTGETDAQIVDCLKELPWRQLRSNQEITCTPGHFCMNYYAPIVDGEGGFLPKTPDKLRESGNFVKGPLITGVCRDDGSFYTLLYVPEANEGDGFTREEFHFFLKHRLIAMWEEQMDNDTYDAVFNAMDFYYSPWPHLDNKWENREALNIMVTDAAFGMPSVRQAVMHSPYNNDTYLFVHGYRMINASDLYPEWMGVPHNGELPFVWGYPRLLHNQAVRDDCRIYIDIIGWSDPEDIAYTYFVQEMWTNFAKYGDPTPYAVEGPLNNTAMIWPAFSIEEQMYLDIDEEVQILENYRPRNHAFWSEYMSKIIDIPVIQPAGDPKRMGNGVNLVERAITTLILKRLFNYEDLEDMYSHYADEVLMD